MKVIFLTPNLEMHGGNLVLSKYANYLANNQHEVVIVTNNQPIGLPLDKRIIIRQYKKFPFRLIDFFTFQLVYTRAIMELIDDCDFIIPVYTPLVLPVILLKKQKKIRAKIVLFFQDFFEMVWVGPYIKFLLGRKFVKDSIFNTIAVSGPIADQFKVTSSKNAYIVANGIEHQYFFPRKDVKKENFLLFVGRPQKTKGYPIFLKTYRLLKKRYPEIKAKVVFPGTKEQKKNDVEFILYKNRQQLALLYNKALIYVNTSPGESFGLPALEAMASGTAVILTDTIGSREYAKDKKNCLVAPVGNIKAIAKSISNLINNSRLRHKLEESGIKTAQKYQWSAAQKKFLDVLLRMHRVT